MDFLISNAYAQGAPAQGDTFGFLFPMLIIFGAFYFLLIRPQQKQRKQHAAMMEALKSGDEVVTAGGILGQVTAISDHFVTLKIADNVQIKVQKATVTAVVPKGTLDAA